MENENNKPQENENVKPKETENNQSQVTKEAEPQKTEEIKKPNKFKAFFKKLADTKVGQFFKKLFKKKAFWICFAIVLLAGIVTWMILAPQDDPTKEVPNSYLTITYAVARFLGLFIILALGLLLGRVTIKGISFGSAGVFLVALAIGALFAIPGLEGQPFIGTFKLTTNDVSIYSDALGNLGLALFASAVGYIAGPTFFRSFKTNAKCYITMGVLVTLIGVVLTAIIGVIPGIAPDGMGSYYASGLFSGAITSTPALAAAKEVALAQGGQNAQTLVTIGYAITYPLGVLGVVLFIQLMPKILHADMSMERGLLIVRALKSEMNEEKDKNARSAAGIIDKEYFKIDDYGLAPFAIAVFLGLLIGSITIPLTGEGYAGPCFSLGTTGGCLLSCIIFGHFGHIGKMSFEVPASTNKVFREFGLIVFLAGIGISGGYSIVNSITSSESTLTITGTMIAFGILLGVVITIVPMILGYFMGKRWFKLPLLNNLGAITGSMTSTPALGALIGMSKTDDVAIAYASAFPIATILTAIAMNLYLSLAAAI